MEPFDDLSDVYPLGVTIGISDGVNEMWMGRRICDIQGYGADGWTTEQMLDYFTDLCRTYDAWADSKVPWVLPADFHNLKLPDDIRNSGCGTWNELRDFVQKCYKHYAPIPIEDLLNHLQLQPIDWLRSVAGGKDINPDWATMKSVILAESYFTSVHPPCEFNELMKVTGMSRSILEILNRLMFSQRRMIIHGEEAAKVDRAPEMLKHLVLKGDYTTPEILAMVHKATGVKFSKSYASKIRVRNKKKK